MPSESGFVVDGFSGVESDSQRSKVASQRPSSAQPERGDEMADNDARVKESSASWERPLMGQESWHSESGDPMEDLPPNDWEELEVRYERDMENATQQEQSIISEIDWVMKMMKESTIASSKTESERAKKRLRTRITSVQQSEEALAEKRTHYQGVVDAFQNAMALLGGV